jgi:hypothetical protein
MACNELPGIARGTSACTAFTGTDLPLDCQAILVYLGTPSACADAYGTAAADKRNDNMESA